MVALQRFNELFEGRLGMWLKLISTCSALALLTAGLVLLFGNRAPPFKIVEFEPASAQACGEAVLRARVWRDPDRDCSVVLSRSFLDSRGQRFDNITARTHISADTLDALENATPGRMAPVVKMPCGAAEGPGIVITPRDYSCNRVQAWLWPIDVTTFHPVTILPP
jgi:hypothetical protein